ncbi:unnamed protein product [Prorocentrum cordatum]|uniref:Uncharacterized protein n=1 Tax=Prorocentrum cordatum TaxID=2364126 RepID=A0ABN9XJX8_9DINO|nr:unnamed protein product [Polarella glacialis]
MEKRIMEKVAAKSSPPAGVAANGGGGGGSALAGGGGADAQAAPPSDDDKLRVRVQHLEESLQALRKCDGVPASAIETVEGELKAARAEVQSKKPVLSRATTLGHKLADKQKKFEALDKSIAEQNKVVEEAQRALAELNDRQRSLRVDIDALKIELQAAMQQVAPSAPEQQVEVDFELDPSVLEGPEADGVKTMLASPEFAKFRQLYAAKAVIEGCSGSGDAMVAGLAGSPQRRPALAVCAGGGPRFVAWRGAAGGALGGGLVARHAADPLDGLSARPTRDREAAQDGPAELFPGDPGDDVFGRDAPAVAEEKLRRAEGGGRELEQGMSIELSILAYAGVAVLALAFGTATLPFLQSYWLGPVVYVPDAPLETLNTGGMVDGM